MILKSILLIMDLNIDNIQVMFLYPISMAEVVQVIKKLSSNYTWLKYSVKEFDVTIVSDEYSMKSYIQPVDVFD